MDPAAEHHRVRSAKTCRDDEHPVDTPSTPESVLDKKEATLVGASSLSQTHGSEATHDLGLMWTAGHVSAVALANLGERNATDSAADRTAK